MYEFTNRDVKLDLYNRYIKDSVENANYFYHKSNEETDIYIANEYLKKFKKQARRTHLYIFFRDQYIKSKNPKKQKKVIAKKVPEDKIKIDPYGGQTLFYLKN